MNEAMWVFIKATVAGLGLGGAIVLVVATVIATAFGEDKDNK